jgi:serine/threonine-protein kinase HipA
VAGPWPTDGAISTHLIKPEPATGAAVNDLIWLEEWTLRLARNAGLSAATAHLEDFDGRVAIIVERYDRMGATRAHQEDFAQALSVAASDKYESSLAAPGRLRQIATVAGAEGSDGALLHRDLLRSFTFNAVIGNGHAHSKNYSLCISSQGMYSLAPLYDAAPVFLVEPRFTHFGHAVNGQTNLRYITGTHLVEEAVAWGVVREVARGIVVEMAEAVGRAIEDTPAEPRITQVIEPIAACAAQFAAHA